MNITLLGINECFCDLFKKLPYLNLNSVDAFSSTQILVNHSVYFLRRGQSVRRALFMQHLAPDYAHCPQSVRRFGNRVCSGDSYAGSTSSCLPARPIPPLGVLSEALGAGAMLACPRTICGCSWTPTARSSLCDRGHMACRA